jgi:hypothetical protein
MAARQEWETFKTKAAADFIPNTVPILTSIRIERILLTRPADHVLPLPIATLPFPTRPIASLLGGARSNSDLVASTAWTRRAGGGRRVAATVGVAKGTGTAKGVGDVGQLPLDAIVIPAQPPVLARSQPPAAEKLLTLLLSPDRLEEVLGDYEEKFQFLADRHGLAHARRWYWVQVVKIAISGPVNAALRTAIRIWRDLTASGAA